MPAPRTTVLLPLSIGVPLAVWFVAAWITHLSWAIVKLSSDPAVTIGHVGLAFLGAFVPPIGAMHGTYLWFN